MATLQQFSRGMLNLRRSAARRFKFKAGKRKKIYIIYMSVASKPRRGFLKYLFLCNWRLFE